MRKQILFFIFIVSIIFPGQIFSWGNTGHRIIAEIAEKNLDRRAKKEVRKLLDNQHMAYWANWADFIKSDTTERWTHTHVWHFVNAPANLGKTEFIEIIKNIPQQNIYSEIPKLENIIKSRTSSKEEKKEALIFLIHLVGDMHQPMHTGREEDLGGNRIKVQWFGQDTNLHSLWDSKLIDFEKYSYSEYADLLNVTSKEQKKRLQQGTLEDWLYDSHTIANMIYDITEPDSSLSFGYNYITKVIVEDQLLKAGLRLAKILNDIM